MLFGLTLNFYFGCFLRFACGACDFLFGIVKIYIAEGVEPAYRAKAMTYSGGMWGIAIIVGPMIGGLLARPTVQYPTVFAADGVFGRLPYLMPCLVVSGSCALCLVLSQVALKETVPNALGFRCFCCARAAKARRARLGCAALEASDAAAKARGAGKKWYRFFVEPRAALPMYIYMLLVTAEVCDDVAFPLWNLRRPTRVGLTLRRGRSERSWPSLASA